MKNLFVVRVPGEYDAQALSDATGLKCLDKSRTSQEFRDEVDINTIARRFKLTGELPEDVRMVMHGDFTDVMDFRQAQDLLVAARESFQAMPAEVRARFKNDAAEFLDFTSNEANFDEAVKLGLVRPEVQAERARKAQEQRDGEVAAAAAEMLKASQAASGEAVRAPSTKRAKDQ